MKHLITTVNQFLDAVLDGDIDRASDIVYDNAERSNELCEERVRGDRNYTGGVLQETMSRTEERFLSALTYLQSGNQKTAISIVMELLKEFGLRTATGQTHTPKYIM